MEIYSGDMSVLYGLHIRFALAQALVWTRDAVASEMRASSIRELSAQRADVVVLRKPDGSADHRRLLQGITERKRIPSDPRLAHHASCAH